MHAQEVRRIELAFELGHRLPHEDLALGRMQPDVLVRRLDPANLLDGDDLDAALPVNREAGGGLARVDVRARVSAFTTTTNELLHALEGLPETHVVEGLQQVVDRLLVEGPHRVLGVGGREHDGRPIVLGKLGQDGQPVHARHLHVEEHHVRSEGAHGREGLHAIGADGDELHPRFGTQELDQHLACHGLVIRQDDAQGRTVPVHGALRRFAHRAAPPPGSDAAPSAPDAPYGPSARRGSRMRTRAPPPSSLSNSKPASFPYSVCRRARVFAKPM